MSYMQLCALALLAVSMWWSYGPKLNLPAVTKKSDVMRHIQAVMEIRDQAENPEVTQACQALLQALLR